MNKTVPSLVLAAAIRLSESVTANGIHNRIWIDDL